VSGATDARPSPTASVPPAHPPIVCPEGTDPRVARSRTSILHATMDLLLEGGIHAVSVDAIAERAGVSKATLYRHWDTRHAIILDALTAMKAGPELPDTGSARGDLVALVRQVADHAASPALAVFGSLVGASEHDPELAEMRAAFAQARSEPMRRLLARWIERGDLPADLDVELFLASVVGPIFYMRLARGELTPPHWPERLVDAALAAHRA
jgi:AcrR family transcriptional regulator